jgi:zinc transport system ATP-binding protein
MPDEMTGDVFILAVKNLSVRIDDQKIIENLSFQVKEGDVITILGPNGAGKTVLLRTLLGLLPQDGEIIWRPDIRIGYVPQRLPFIKDIPLSVQDFFRLKTSSEEEIKRLLYSVGFRDDCMKRKAGDLSSGQFQRILMCDS